MATARVERFLSFAELTEHDTLLDLGCGDGRVLRCAARQVGCRCVGVDVDSSLLETARREASREQVGELCSWLLADFRSAEVERALAQASCAVVFLVPGALHVVAQVLQTHYRTRLRDGGAGSRAEGSAARPLRVVSMVYHFSEASELSVVRSDPLWRLQLYQGTRPTSQGS